MAAAGRTILCGVDGSEHAVRAARVAGVLAEPLAAELVLVHVRSTSVRRRIPLAYHQTSLQEREIERAGELLVATAERAGLEAPRMRRVEATQATSGLLAAAASERPVLMLVGARGRARLGRALLGSVSAELPVRAPCPVAVVPPEASVPDLRAAEGSRPAIVCGVAGADEARSAAIVAGQLAEALDATLVLVYSRLATAGFGDRPPTRHGIGNWELLAEHERRVALRGLARAARWSGRRPERVALVLEVGDPAERIEAVARRTNAALAIVGCRGGGSLRAAVRGSTCRALAARARRPVVICTKQASPRLLAGTPLAAPSCCVVRPPDLRCGAPASPERRAAAPP